MNLKSTLVLVCAFAAFGCEAIPGATLREARPRVVPAGAKAKAVPQRGSNVLACTTAFQDCDQNESRCCDGLICDLDRNTYGEIHCVPRFADGDYCFENNQCQNRHCIDNVCRPQVCVAQGETCYDPEVSCCAGTFCSFDGSAYGIARCEYQQAEGSACVQDEECFQSGCIDGTCTSGGAP